MVFPLEGLPSRVGINTEVFPQEVRTISLRACPPIRACHGGGKPGVGPDPDLAEASALVLTLQSVVRWLALSAFLPSTALLVQFYSLLRENLTTIFSWTTFKMSPFRNHWILTQAIYRLKVGYIKTYWSPQVDHPKIHVVQN